MYTPSETCLSRHSGRVNAHFFQTHVKSLARKLKLALFWLCLPLKQTKLNKLAANQRNKHKKSQTLVSCLQAKSTVEFSEKSSPSLQNLFVCEQKVKLQINTYVGFFFLIPTNEWTRPTGVVPYIGHHVFHNHGIMDLIAELGFVVKHEYHETGFFIVVRAALMCGTTNKLLHKHSNNSCLAKRPPETSAKSTKNDKTCVLPRKN